MYWIPEEDGIILMFSGPERRICVNDFSPFKTCDKLNSGRNPSMTLILAKPRSASKSNTFFPFLDKAIDRLMEVLLFPTPPFPLVIAIT